MTIERTAENESIILAVSGELTVMTAEQLSNAVKTAVTETGALVLDFANMEYVSSAGLRVLLEAKKLMDAKKGELIIRNVSEALMRTFEIVGFSDILRFE